MKITNSSLIVFWGNKANYRRSALLRTSWKNRKGNIEVTFQITQSASKRCLLPMLLVFPFLCNRSMYHVPDVTRGTDGTCGTFVPSGTWYVRAILIKLAFAFVTFCKSKIKILLTTGLSEVFAAAVPTAFPIRQCCLRKRDKSEKQNGDFFRCMAL